MEPAEMLEARLALVERVRRAELAAAAGELARCAAELVRGRTHALGNSVQIVRLASLELERRLADGPAEVRELVGDLRGAADEAATVLGELLAAARPAPRSEPGAPVAAAVRAAAELARPALAAPLALACELADDVRTLATASELEAIVIAALLDARGATRLHLAVHVRTIQGRPWVQLVRTDDRSEVAAFDSAIAAIAAPAGGEVSLSAGRSGWELAIELPAAG